MKNIKLLFLSTIITVLLFSCDVTSPVAPEPINPKLEKGHDEWAKVEFTFYEGHTHGWHFHGSPQYPESVLYFRQPQTISFTQGKNGVEVSGNKTINLMGGRYYAIIINYYNAKGESMNHEYIDGGMDQIHQHFFSVENLKPNRDDAKTDLITGLPSGYTYDPFELKLTPNPPLVQGKTEPYLFYYVYQDKADTQKDTPLKKRVWDSQNPDSYDPIGLKGYMYISPETYFQKFDLRVFLAHFITPNKLKKNGEPYSFNEIPGGAETDLSVKIPINIFSSVNFENSEEDKNKYHFPEAAKAFNISVEEARADYERQLKITPTLDPESSPIWL